MVTSCGEQVIFDEPMYPKLRVEADSGVQNVSIKDGDTIISDLTRIEERT